MKIVLYYRGGGREEIECLRCRINFFVKTLTYYVKGKHLPLVIFLDNDIEAVEVIK